MNEIIAFNHVEKIFRQSSGIFRKQIKLVRALHDISFTVKPGEILAYAGPNGAGKSTTIRLLASLLSPDKGLVRCLGFNPVKDRVAYVKQIGVFFGHRTELWWDQPVEASYRWKRVVWDITKTAYEKRLGQLKEVLGLGDLLKTLSRELSLGQRVRADLGMLLLHEPRLLLLDEPTIGLDVLTKKSLLSYIKELNRQRGLSIVITSHDMLELEQLAGRIILIDKGRLAFDGDFLALRKRYGDKRRLVLETNSQTAPELPGAVRVKSTSCVHEYLFDAEKVRIPELFKQAARQVKLFDVETHRVPIDDVIAEIYRGWKENGTEHQ